MFTGIITHKGTVSNWKTSEGVATVTLSIPGIKAHIGQSIAVNGVCLTVIQAKGKLFSFDVVAETLKLTNLGSLQIGSQVNIEKSLNLGDSLDGSFVLGHIDATTRLKTSSKSDLSSNEDKNIDLTFEIPTPLKKYIVKKGGIVINGVALTVTNVTKNSFSVTIIPHTLNATTLNLLAKGSCVNLEVDAIARYVVNAL